MLEKNELRRILVSPMYSSILYVLKEQLQNIFHLFSDTFFLKSRLKVAKFFGHFSFECMENK